MTENENINQARNGYELVNFCEFDKYASRSYCAVHGVDESLNLGDITEVDETKLKAFNMIGGGSPCFPAGTKILTKKGYKNIEEVKVGDLVFTHCDRYMPVNRIGGEVDKEIYSMKVQGFLEIYATSYHPFYVKRRKDAPPEKMCMSDIQKGFYISSPINTEAANEYNLTDEQCWILGRYVADGHIRRTKRKGRKNSYQCGVVLSIGQSKIDDVMNHITEYNFSCYPHTQSTYRLVVSSKNLVEFIESHGFGKRADEKTIPQFILDLPIDKLSMFLDGYMSGDGCEIKDSGLYSACTVSKELALSLCAAVQKVYRVGCKVYFNQTKDTTIIEGRSVNQKDFYIIRFRKQAEDKHLWFIEDNKIWYPVKAIESTGRVENVYNLEVDTDHTYVADNIVTFNCQDFSVAGKQAGSKWKCRDCDHEYNPLTVHWSERDKCPNCGSVNLDKTRSSLLVEWLRIIRANKPVWGIYENVKNIVGKQFKETFDMFINELHEYGYNTYYQVLNAKDYGVPQNRERVYLIIIQKEFDNGKFTFPEPFDNGKRLKDVLEDEVDEKFYINTPKAKELIEELIESGRLDKHTSNTVRGGGHGSLDRHQWDLVQTK